MLLGIQEQLDEPVAALTLKPGDTLVFASDGLTEAFNDTSEMFGIGRLEQLLAANRCSSVDVLADRMIDAVDEFSANDQVHDDRTVLAVRFRHNRDERMEESCVSKKTQQ